MPSVDYERALQDAGFDQAFLEALRAEAEDAGDHRVAQLCARALDGDVGAVGDCRRAIATDQISRLEALEFRRQDGGRPE